MINRTKKYPRRRKNYLIHITDNKSQGTRANDLISLRNILPGRPIPIKTHFPTPRLALSIRNWSRIFRLIHPKTRNHPLGFCKAFFPSNCWENSQVRTMFGWEYKKLTLLKRNTVEKWAGVARKTAKTPSGECEFCHGYGRIGRCLCLGPREISVAIKGVGRAWRWTDGRRGRKAIRWPRRIWFVAPNDGLKHIGIFGLVGPA